MEKMKRVVYVVFMSTLLGLSFPALAQNTNETERDRTERSVDRDNNDNRDSDADRREDVDDSEARGDRDEDDSDGGKWGLLGLLGLAGLLGLRRNNDKVHHTTTTRPTGTMGGGTGNFGDSSRTGGTSAGSGSGTIITP